MNPNNHAASPRFLRLASCLAVGGLLLLAACSGGTGGGATGGQPTVVGQATRPAAEAKPTEVSPRDRGGKIDPCVLTKEEVEAAVGRPVLAPREQEDAATASCDYRDPVATASGDSRLVFRTVGVRVLVGGGADYGPTAVAKAKETYETNKKNAADAQPVAGIGEDAYWDKLVTTISVLRGRYEVKVYIKSDELGGVNVAKALAAKVLERLP